MLPIKLEKLHSCGVFEVLPTQLLSRTPYLKYAEEFVSIITELHLKGASALGGSADLKQLALQTLHPTLEKTWALLPIL